MQGTLGLRARLLVVVTAALLPLLGVYLWGAMRDSQAAIAMAQSQLRFSASLLAANQDRVVDAAQQLLGAIAQMPEIRAMDRARCQSYFESLRDRYPMYSNIGLIDPEGQVLCHALGSRGTPSARDRDYFVRALKQQRFVIGEPIVGRIANRPALPFAMPVLERGLVVGVVFASFDLQAGSLRLGSAGLPPGSRVTVADRHGHILLEHPANGELLRESVHQDLLQAGRAMLPVDGEQPAPNGEMRLFAIAPSALVGDQGFVVRVGLPADALRHAAWQRGAEELLLLAAVMGLALLAVWWIGGRMIVKPAKQLLGAARRIEEGGFEARVPMLPAEPRGEFARLGFAFNRMADSLQMRQADLEAELGRSRNAYAVLDQVLNSMHEGLVAVTRDGKFLLHNAAAARLVPIADAPALPELWPEHFGIYHPEDGRIYRAEELPLVRSALGESDGQVLVLVRNHLVPEGRMVLCTWRRMESDSVQGGLVVYSDVTELQQLETERAAHLSWLVEAQHKNARLLGEVRELNAGLEARIAERTAQLQAANEELETFSYSVSHDLRAPLAAIAGFSRALEGKVKDAADERTMHYFARIQAGVHKMEELIESLLQLSRVTRAQLESTDVDLSALARDAVENLRMEQPSRDVTVHVQDGLTASGDARLLRAMMTNLVGNAWKFTGAARQPSIEVGRTDDGAFYVRDNGVGFDMSYAAKLFTAFHRLHKESDFPGTGIGLATVHRIVKRHQGRVWAQSRPGEGTTFYFTL